MNPAKRREIGLAHAPCATTSRESIYRMYAHTQSSNNQHGWLLVTRHDSVRVYDCLVNQRQESDQE
jgi:hypothetical protein